MTYSNQTPSEQKSSTVQTWVISLAISIFFCAIVCAVIAHYLGGFGKTLAVIDNRLANIEARAMLGAAPSVPTSTTVTVTPPEAAEQIPSAAPIDSPPPVTTPSVGEPGAAAPAPVPETPSASAPAPEKAMGGAVPSEAPAGSPEPIVPPSSAPATTP